MSNKKETSKNRSQTLSEKIIFVLGMIIGFHIFVVCLVYYGLAAITEMSILENMALVTLSILIMMSLPDFGDDNE